MKKNNIVIKNSDRGDLVISEIEPYFDFTGSYMDHYEGKMNREPTSLEMKTLKRDYKVVSLTGCFCPEGSPLGWDEQNQRMTNTANIVDQKIVFDGCFWALATLIFIVGGIYIIYKAISIFIIPQLPTLP
jgi:hypothetical protein